DHSNSTALLDLVSDDGLWRRGHSGSTVPPMTFDEAAWRKHFEWVEGRRSHLYLDGEGIVTVGVGCQVFNPAELRMLHKSDSLPASRDEIVSEYSAIKIMPSGRVPAYYDAVCRLYLASADIDALFLTRLKKFIAEVE